MTYIKKLVLHGFKSFPKKTEIPLTNQINVILGPNGSGKSNITDALCFVLGRLSAKSMRAAKSKNLIFMGTKSASPSKEASVEITFDNTDKTFSLDSKEISIKRIVRRNGQSIYKINNETKTRQEILSLLAQAGIDPNGFNIILQGEIQNFIKMHNEERRRIIEEVSGISVYETRKEKSLKELNKTDEKLKEVLAILKERTSYLNNLEKERQQALRFKKLEKDIKKFKASIIQIDLKKKQNEKENILLEISKKNKEIAKIKSKVVSINTSIKSFEEKIILINQTIQKSTGLEQEKLNKEIANIRAELAGIKVKFENYESRLAGLSKQKQELNELIRNNEVSIKELQSESPTIAKKQKEIDKKKKELEELEEEKKKFYMIKSELKSIRERFADKQNLLQNYNNESSFLLQQINLVSGELFDKKTTREKLDSLKQSLSQKKELLESLNKKEKEFDKVSLINESEIEKQNKLIDNISKMDICPVCKSKITPDHLSSIKEEILPKISLLKDQITNSDKELNQIYYKRDLLKKEIEDISIEISKRESDLLKILSINEKKNQIKTLQENIDKLNLELKDINKRKTYLESVFEDNSNIEKKYETVLIEVQEISLRSKENFNSEISFKQRELERSKISLKQIDRDEVDYKEELAQIKKTISIKNEILTKKRKQEEVLTKKFQKLIQERDSCQIKIRHLESELSEENNHIYNKEQEVNNFNIIKAKVKAEIESLENDSLEFKSVEIIKGNRDILAQRLNKTQDIISKIGSVNLRSLEVYDKIKEEYDAINNKVEVISKEKEGILKIIHTVDIQKKKVFFKTLTELNEIFSRNFSKISTKGQVFLELENKKEPFEGGVGIVVKTGHGKYFDVTSLSGGEQTMVALSLIFAIQELNPYCFYILDEIDAALDKRNSGRLASLLSKYMQRGQYIVISHNDEVILNASNLYGISMHDGISKVISMRV